MATRAGAEADGGERGTVLPEVELALDLALALDGEHAWEVLEGELEEGLSQLYRATLQVVTTDPAPDLRALVGSRATLRLRRGEQQRQVHGILWSLREKGPTLDGRLGLQLVVVPALQRLSRRSDHRVLAGLALQAILRDVLERAGLYQAEGQLELHLESSGPAAPQPRELCVQYGETDLAFLMRLCEEEGVSFYFRHEQPDHETLVFVDARGTTLADRWAPVDSGAQGAELALVAPDHASTHHRESVTRLTWQLEVATDGVELCDHDFTRSTLRDAMHASAPRGGATTLQEYRFPGRFVFVDYAAPALELPAFLVTAPIESAPVHGGHSGRQRAETLLEGHRARAERLEGTGNAIDFGAGRTFRLLNHPRAALEQEYLITGVRHVLRAPEVVLDGAPDRLTHRYENRFVCIPRAVPFRPPEDTPKPRIHGTQTATVVGEAGEEIHTDWYGRVKVQLHWDREHTAHRNLLEPANALLPGGSAAPLAWVRCAQAWAGSGWGTQFVPRVGMEVVLTFLDGDPDRPLVVGCVYDDVNPPLHALPGRQDRSGIRTRSTPQVAKRRGRLGYNELSFRDTAEQEQIYLHAERDLDVHVRNNHSLRVLGWQDTAVHQHETHVVHADQRERVVGNQSLAVGLGQSVTVDGPQVVRVGEDRTVEVRGGAEHHVEPFQALRLRGFSVHHVSHPHDAVHHSDPELERALDELERLRAEIHEASERRFARVSPARTGHDVVRPRDEHGPPGGGPSPRGPGAEGAAPPGAPDRGGGSGDGDAAEEESQDAPESTSDDAPAEEVPPYLETWVVDGDRYKHVRGHERVHLETRHTEVHGSDVTDVGNQWELTASRTAALRLVGTEDLEHVQRLVMLHDPPRLDLRMGKNGVKLTPDMSRLRFDEASVRLDGDGALLSSSDGRVAAQLTDDDDAYGLEVSDGGSTVEIVTKDGSVRLTDALEVKVNGKIKLSNGGASIELSSGGEVTITGSTITLDGNVRTR